MLDPRFSSQPRERSLPPSSALQLGLNQAIPPHLSADSSAGGILGQKAIYFFAAPLYGEMLLMQERGLGDSCSISPLLNLWTSAECLYEMNTMDFHQVFEQMH